MTSYILSLHVTILSTDQIGALQQLLYSCSRYFGAKCCTIHGVKSVRSLVISGSAILPAVTCTPFTILNMHTHMRGQGFSALIVLFQTNKSIIYLW